MDVIGVFGDEEGGEIIGGGRGELEGETPLLIFVEGLLPRVDAGKGAVDLGAGGEALFDGEVGEAEGLFAGFGGRPADQEIRFGGRGIHYLRGGKTCQKGNYASIFSVFPVQSMNR
mgnify:CR=1 FL=1